MIIDHRDPTTKDLRYTPFVFWINLEEGTIWHRVGEPSDEKWELLKKNKERLVSRFGKEKDERPI